MKEIVYIMDYTDIFFELTLTTSFFLFSPITPDTLRLLRFFILIKVLFFGNFFFGSTLERGSEKQNNCSNEQTKKNKSNHPSSRCLLLVLFLLGFGRLFDCGCFDILCAGFFTSFSVNSLRHFQNDVRIENELSNYNRTTLMGLPNNKLMKPLKGEISAICKAVCTFQTGPQVVFAFSLLCHAINNVTHLVSEWTKD